MQALQLLPLRFTSYLWGLLTHVELPTWMRGKPFRGPPPIYK
jgi:phosphatidylserine decarboxylase